MHATSPPLDAGEPEGAGIADSGLLPAGYRAARLLEPRRLREADALYKRVFAYDDPSFSLNPNLLTSLGHNGGSSVGVFDSDDTLVGYAYGFAGRDCHGGRFHFSQAAVVDPREQGRGLGRALKHLQALEAQRSGEDEMRWTFDPLLARNAHFNLDSLAATGIAVLPRYFGTPGSDRVLVSWDLPADCTARPPAADPPPLGRDDWCRARETGDGSWIALPAEQPGPAEAAPLRTALTATLQAVLAAGSTLIACRRLSADTAAYFAARQKGASHD